MIQNSLLYPKKRGVTFIVFVLSGAGFGLLFDQKSVTVSFFPSIFLFLLPFFLIAPLSRSEAFLEGAVFGMVANLLGIRWLLGTMENYGHIPWPLAFGGLFLFSSYLSLYPALFRYAMFRMHAWRIIDGRPSLTPGTLLLAPTLWVLSEAGKTEILTGFPWNTLGALLFGHRNFVLPAKVVGTTGLSFLIVLVSALAGISIDRMLSSRNTPGIRRSATAWILVTVLTLSVWPLWGRSLSDNPPPGSLPQRDVALIQGNIPPDQKWTPDHLRSDLGTYLSMSRQETAQGATLLVWPETALPVFYNAPLPIVTQKLRDLLSSGAYLLTGSIGEIPAPDQPMGVAFTNAAVLYGPEGDVVANYVKQHLVPFGEYLPLPIIFGWLRPLLGVAGDMAHSDHPARFPLPGGFSVSPVICYEALYPSLVRNSLGRHANILAVISDDAWFGNTSAPYQLFRESAMRSVENGVPMLRAANTGVSGVVTPNGEVAVSGPLFQTLALRATVKAGPGNTFYRRHGEWVLKISLLGFLFWLAVLPIARKHGTLGEGKRRRGFFSRL